MPGSGSGKAPKPADSTDSGPQSSDSASEQLFATLFSVNSSGNAQYSGLAATESLAELQECTLLNLVAESYFTSEEFKRLNKCCTPQQGIDVGKPLLNFILGCLCLTKQGGFGVKYARRFFECALEGKFYRARFYLAICYLSGIGGGKDTCKAKTLFKKCQGLEKMRIRQWAAQISNYRLSQSGIGSLGSEFQPPRDSDAQIALQCREQRESSFTLNKDQLLAENSAYVQSLVDIFEEYAISMGSRSVHEYQCWQKPALDRRLTDKNEADRIALVNASVTLAFSGNAFAVSHLKEQSVVQSLVSKCLGLEPKDSECQEISQKCVQSGHPAEIEFQVAIYRKKSGEVKKSKLWLELAASNGSSNANVEIIAQELGQASKNSEANWRTINQCMLRLKALGNLKQLLDAAEWQLGKELDRSVGIQMLELVVKDSIVGINEKLDQGIDKDKVSPPIDSTILHQPAISQPSASSQQPKTSIKAHQLLLQQYAEQFYEVTAEKSCSPGDQSKNQHDGFLDKALPCVLWFEAIDSEDYGILKIEYWAIRENSKARPPEVNFADETVVDWPRVAVLVFQTLLQNDLNDMWKAMILNDLIIHLNTQWMLVWALMQSCSLAKQESSGAKKARANLESYYNPKARISGRARQVLYYLKAVIQNAEATPISLSETLQGNQNAGMQNDQHANLQDDQQGGLQGLLPEALREPLQDTAEKKSLASSGKTPSQTEYCKVSDQPKLQKSARVGLDSSIDSEASKLPKTQ